MHIVSFYEYKFLRIFEGFSYDLTLSLGLVKRIDQTFVFENVSWRISEFSQQFLFKWRQINLQLLLFFQKFLFLFLNFRLEIGDDDGEKFAF